MKKTNSKSLLVLTVLKDGLVDVLFFSSHKRAKSGEPGQRICTAKWSMVLNAIAPSPGVELRVRTER